MSQLELTDACAFDLPEWLGTEDVTWHSLTGLRTGHVVTGELRAGDQRTACDLFGVDEAYPEPVADEAWRQRTHRAWRNGQVELGFAHDRLVVSVPDTRVDAERVIEALSRLARAVGASPERWSVNLRIGVDQSAGRRR